MIVSCCNRVLFQTSNYLLFVNGVWIDLLQNETGIYEILNVIRLTCEAFPPEQLLIDSRPSKYSLADEVLLLGVGQCIEKIYVVSEKKKYDITFSYNFPIFREQTLIKKLATCIYKIASAQLIALGEDGDFLCVDVSDPQQYRRFINRKRQLINKNGKVIRILQDESMYTALKCWQAYCNDRFRINYPETTIEALAEVYSFPGFNTISYHFRDSIVAQGVIFDSEYSNTLYYCVFSWNKEYARLSPGIYAYSQCVIKCHNENKCFSMCYGQQDYKKRLLKEFL